MLIYIDETGDLGFNFKLKRTSRYFVISALTFEEYKDLKLAITLIERVKRRQNLNEVKGKNIHPTEKKKIHKQLKKLKWHLHSIIIEKNRIRAPKDTGILYDTLVTKLLKDCINKHKEQKLLVLTLDYCKNNQEEVTALNKKIKQEFIKLNCAAEVKIYHSDSKENAGLQMCDFYSYGVYKKFENSNEDWFECFKDKIRSIRKL